MLPIFCSLHCVYKRPLPFDVSCFYHHTIQFQAQALAGAAIATVDELAARGSPLSIRWTPSHRRVLGNEQADEMAQLAAEEEGKRAGADYIQKASLPHLTRKTTEARTQATAERICERVGRRRRYRPPPGGRFRRELAREPKELAGRFYRLLLGHAAAAEHLTGVGQAASERCRWCGSGERQTRYHLSWGVGDELWRSRDCGEELRGTMGGADHVRPPSASSLETREQRRRSWSS